MKKNKNKSLFNRLNAWLHLWPSIVAGVVVVFVCITGTIIVYGDEIMDLTAGDAKYVTPRDERISAEEIMINLEEAYPGYAVSEFVFFKDPTRSIRLRAFNRQERRLSMIYMNPYTGEVLKKDDTIYFFFVTAHLHASFLAGEIGHWVVAISTIIFVISCITGLILWYPKKWNKKTFNDSFTVRWKAKFKRLNYDLHNVYGFYSLIIAVILGVTGLMIFFHGFMDLTVKLTGGDTADIRELLPKMDTTKTSLDMVPFAYQVLESEYQDKEEVSIWNFDAQKLGVFAFRSGHVGLKSIENADLDIYDRYTGEKILLDEKHLQHEATENVIWQLHLGQWWGQIGKLSTFLAGIVSTSLPITGFIIWWGRRKKKKASTQKSPIPSSNSNKSVNRPKVATKPTIKPKYVEH